MINWWQEDDMHPGTYRTRYKKMELFFLCSGNQRTAIRIFAFAIIDKGKDRRERR